MGVLKHAAAAWIFQVVSYGCTSPVVPQIFVFFVSFPHFFDVNSHGYSDY